MSILTEEMEARLVALHDQGLSDRAVATEMGVSQSVVRVALYRAHRLPDHSIKRLGDKFDAVVTGWEDRLTVKELAGMAGKSHDAMKWILVIMKAYGHIKPRKQTPHNKGKLMPMRKKHQVVFDKMMAVPGWEKMKRKEMAAAVKMPINVFIIYWRIFRNRGLVGPKAQGRIKGSAASIAVMSRSLAVGGDKVQSLWATALGRRTL